MPNPSGRRWVGGGRRLLAVDGDIGVYVAVDDGLVPATTTAVYRALTTLLPTDADLPVG